MPASAGVQSMMREIAEALHISSRTSFEQLRGRVANALDGSRLLLIDEVHECFVSYQKSSMVKSLNVLRQLQETTKCGMVLCGTNVFRHEIERGEFAQALKQLRRRGIWELQLESVPTDGDLALIARHYRLPAPDEKAQELVGWIAAEMGLGKYTKFLARASEMASQKRETMTWEHFSRVVQIAETLRKAPGNIKGN
jgi:DNA transposition AAA+ family ATPase